MVRLALIPATSSQNHWDSFHAFPLAPGLVVLRLCDLNRFIFESCCPRQLIVSNRCSQPILMFHDAQWIFPAPASAVPADERDWDGSTAANECHLKFGCLIVFSCCFFFLNRPHWTHAVSYSNHGAALVKPVDFYKVKRPWQVNIQVCSGEIHGKAFKQGRPTCVSV